MHRAMIVICDKKEGTKNNCSTHCSIWLFHGSLSSFPFGSSVLHTHKQIQTPRSAAFPFRYETAVCLVALLPIQYPWCEWILHLQAKVNFVVIQGVSVASCGAEQRSVTKKKKKKQIIERNSVAFSDADNHSLNTIFLPEKKKGVKTITKRALSQWSPAYGLRAPIFSRLQHKKKMSLNWNNENCCPLCSIASWLSGYFTSKA